MTKESINILSMASLPIFGIPMGLFYERQYHLAIFAFLIGAVILATVPLSRRLLVSDNWYKKNIYIAYPMTSGLSAIFGYTNISAFFAFVLFILYLVWSSAMWGEIRKKYLASDESKNEPEQ